MKRQVYIGERSLEYELVKTDRRDLSIKVTKNDVRLYAPRMARLRDCDAFVKEQWSWIARTRGLILDYERKYASEHPLEDGARLMYEGDFILLDIKKSDKTAIWREDGALLIRSPDTGREALRAILRNYLTDMARTAVDESLRKYVPIVGKAPKAVRLREQKTRWGSCSSEGNINLNWKLIMAPRQSLDYVVAHELCHLYELNHSNMFWRRVKSVMPDYEYWKKWLKDNSRALGI